MSGMRKILSGVTTIPVLAFKSADEAVRVCGILIEKGLTVLELTMRHESALDALKAVKNTYGDAAVVGMGTITQADQVKGIINAGADFGVSPGFTQKIAKTVTKSGLPFLPAIATVSEAMRAREMGFDTLKFFPAEQSGGASFLKGINAVLPELRFCPTGGVNEKNAHEYLALDNVVCFGSSAFVVRGDNGDVDEDAIRQAVARFRKERLIN